MSSSSQQSPSKITFFERFEADILSGKKTLTIRNEEEKHYLPNTHVDVYTFEDDRWFCRLNILAVEPILFNNLSIEHAQQENMTLATLKSVIQEIYPGITQLYVIYYELVAA
ncbi:N(4)-acetylcytidine aminohydrolase [Psychromonas sp. 14N.309.X.WAT.B.A12]|uniref:N(4)-acetylcytidine aminohydrolase n=1 Tax=unclassified Psychromonas TaxID=2614957 RepID=UPI0025AF4E92|nr:N(4)-acetylcytidine aminohydrolase [Psychromonas sp. 14N.309.X.WAT.B.A12]MDN2662298.1 N(4)-acetylcytidine aminohydrolase [Psychromonas sp. 14N.309.X.WAT.B.A12]